MCVLEKRFIWEFSDEWNRKCDATRRRMHDWTWRVKRNKKKKKKKPSEAVENRGNITLSAFITLITTSIGIRLNLCNSAMQFAKCARAYWKQRSKFFELFTSVCKLHIRISSYSYICLPRYGCSVGSSARTLQSHTHTSISMRQIFERKKFQPNRGEKCRASESFSSISSSFISLKSQFNFQRVRNAAKRRQQNAKISQFLVRGNTEIISRQTYRHGMKILVDFWCSDRPTAALTRTPRTTVHANGYIPFL